MLICPTGETSSIQPHSRAKSISACRLSASLNRTFVTCKGIADVPAAPDVALTPSAGVVIASPPVATPRNESGDGPPRPSDPLPADRRRRPLVFSSRETESASPLSSPPPPVLSPAADASADFGRGAPSIAISITAAVLSGSFATFAQSSRGCPVAGSAIT